MQCTGGEDGFVSVHDLADGQCVNRFRAAPDCVNGFNFHPFLNLSATASGNRKFLVRSTLLFPNDNNDKHAYAGQTGKFYTS
jgi:hypothetical protein